MAASLLDRSGGNLVLTQAGRALLPDFERIEKNVEAVVQRARGYDLPTRETIRIGAPTSLIANIVAPVMARLQEHRALTYVSLLEVDDDSVYDLVRAGDIDLAVTSIAGGDAHLDARPLIEDRPCVVFPSGHPLDGASPVNPAEVAAYKLIRLPVGTIANHFTDALAEQSGSELDFAAEATRLMTIEVLIRSGIGLAMLPGLSARLIAANGLRYRVVALTGVLRHSQLIMSKSARISRAAHFVADQLFRESEKVCRANPDVCVAP